MILILDGASDALIDQIEREARQRWFFDDISKITVEDIVPESITDLRDEYGHLRIFRSYPVTNGDIAKARYTDLYLASEGVRYWGPNLTEEYPTYAGDLPEAPEDFTQVMIDGGYSQAVTQYSKNTYKGVQFTGRSFASPKTMILLDAKRKINPHDPEENPAARVLLESLTGDFWGLTALVSTSSAPRLERFVEDHDQTIPITTSTGTSAKLNFAGFNFVSTDIPKESSKEFGIKLRSSVTLFERQ